MFLKIFVVLAISSFTINQVVNGCTAKNCMQCKVDQTGNKFCDICWKSVQKNMITPSTVRECVPGTIANCIMYHSDMDSVSAGCYMCEAGLMPTQNGNVGNKPNFICSAPTIPVENCVMYTVKGCAICKDGLSVVNKIRCVAPTTKIANC